MITGVRTRIALAAFVGACGDPRGVEPSTQKSAAVAAPSPTPVVDVAPTLHVVATRRGPIALSTARGAELALAGVLPVALRTTEPLVVDARHREGLHSLTEGIAAPTVDLVRFDGRWPHEATLVAHVENDSESVARGIRWNGEAWRRDDELAEVATMPASIALPEADARFAVTPEGWVFAAGSNLAIWSPGATEWTTSELPDGTDAEIAGFVARAKDDVYAFGMRGLAVLSARAGYIAHWDGRTWESIPGPKCNDGIAKLAPGPSTTWAYCASEHYEPRRPPPTRELWRTTAHGGWEPMPQLRATDIATTADGTLWIVLYDEDTTWSLVRSSAPAQSLSMPNDDELFATPANASQSTR